MEQELGLPVPSADAGHENTAPPPRAVAATGPPKRTMRPSPVELDKPDGNEWIRFPKWSRSGGLDQLEPDDPSVIVDGDACTLQVEPSGGLD